MTDPFEHALVDECYAPPTFETISLDCEITSYAPDGDDSPLF